MVHRNYLKDNSAETGSRNRSYSEIIWKKGEKKDSEALNGETWRQQFVVFLCALLMREFSWTIRIFGQAKVGKTCST
jgi:hypothetical protein